MTRLPRALVLGFALSEIMSGQTAQPPQSNTGIEVAAQLNKDLNAKKLKIGDKVEAQVIQDVIVNGRILIPRDSKLVGHVIAVDVLSKEALSKEAVSKNDGQSRVSLVFQEGHLKKDGRLNFQGLIEALGPPLPEPVLGPAMAPASPYNPSTTGHPVPGPMGQSNATTPVMQDRWGDSGVQGLEQRQRALDDARRTGHPAKASPNEALSVSSRGVFGHPGISLSHSQATSTIIAVGKNVHLQSGSQMVLRLESLAKSAGK